MEAANSIWQRSTKLLLVFRYTSAGQLNDFREAIKSVGLNVHNCHVLAVVEDKKQALKDLGSVTYLSEKEFNLIGKLKNEKAQKTLNERFDLLVIVGDLPKRIQKLLSKKKEMIGVGINNSIDFLTINLTSEESSPSHIINFVKNTLNKIS